MKHLLLLCSLFLLLATPAARAAFLIKKVSVVHANSISQTATKGGKINFFSKLDKYKTLLHPYQYRKPGEWVGIAAVGCGVLGILVPGVNLLAILFGVLGMGRGCKVEGLAIAGFVMGVLELILYLLIQAAFVSLILL